MGQLVIFRCHVKASLVSLEKSFGIDLATCRTEVRSWRVMVFVLGVPGARAQLCWLRHIRAVLRFCDGLCEPPSRLLLEFRGKWPVILFAWWLGADYQLMFTSRLRLNNNRPTIVDFPAPYIATSNFGVGQTITSLED